MGEIGPLTIAVCVKFCPDTAQLKADPQTGAPRLDEAPQRISTFDENALEEAVRLKETHGGRVIAVSLAAQAPPPELGLRVLAMGADERRVIVDTTAGRADALATSRILAAALKRLGRLDLVICGEGSLDAYNRQVGPRVAEELEIPVLSHVTRIEARDGRLLIHRALEDRTVIVTAALPLLLTVGQEINQPRFPTVLQIKGASSKPVTTWGLPDLGFGQDDTAEKMSGVTTLDVSAPARPRLQIPIEGATAAELARELAGKLFEQGLVKIE